MTQSGTEDPPSDGPGHGASERGGGQGALCGLRVLDMGRVLAAPWAGQILADMGADVIKLERPGEGDEGRGYGLTTTDFNGRPTPGTMATAANRNKRGIAVDFSTPAGGDLVRRLAAKADILLENFLPGVLGRYGLGYEDLRALNPGLIYCSITGYGQTGPSRMRPGYDAIFQAYGGLMSVTGLPDDVPGGGPMKTGPSVVDVATGYVATVGILTALHHRTRTGQGQHVDASLLDAVISLQSSMVQGYLFSHDSPPRKGTAGNGGHPSHVFTCADGDIYIGAGHQGHYERLCGVLGVAQLVDDPRFVTNRLRFINRAAWNAIAEPVIRTWRKRDLEQALVAARVPVALVNTYAEVFADPQVVARGIEIKGANPSDPGGEISMIASPIRLSETPAVYRRPPPNLGEHTDEVLADWLGLDAAGLAALRGQGVI